MSKGHHSSSPQKTPAEQRAAALAQPYLAEYKSGKLSPSEQAVANLSDTNATAAALQSFASSGMGASSSLGLTTGVVTKGTATQAEQAGAGSSIDLSKLNLTNNILQNDLQIGMSYLEISSGQASQLGVVEQQQASLMAGAIGKASENFAQAYGYYQPQTQETQFSPTTFNNEYNAANTPSPGEVVA